MATRIIISGTIDMPPENTLRAIETARPLIEGALTEEGCLDYDWCPNPLVPGRIRILERWESEEALAAHFKSDWYLKMREHIGNFGLMTECSLHSSKAKVVNLYRIKWPF